MRCANRALTGVACAFLSERLTTAAAYLGASFGALRTGTAGGELSSHDLMHAWHVWLNAKHGVIEVDLAGVFACDVLEGDLCHENQAPFRFDVAVILTALRTETVPPLGPGTEPLINNTLRSTSDSTTSRFNVVTCS